MEKNGRAALMGRGWPKKGGQISSPLPRCGRLASVELSRHGGMGVCGGVPSGVPHALPVFVLARDKYIAPLNLQKASKR